MPKSARVYYLDPKTKKKRYAVRENGFFILASRAKYGDDYNKQENCEKVRTDEEMINLIRQDYYVRVESKSRPSLVRLHIYADGKLIT